MIEAALKIAAQPAFAWTVLLGAAVAFGVAAFRAGDSVLWGDMVEDDE